MTRFPVDGTGRLSSEVEHPSAALTGPAGGDLSGSFPNPAVATVNGHAASSVANVSSPTKSGSFLEVNLMDPRWGVVGDGASNTPTDDWAAITAVIEAVGSQAVPGGATIRVPALDASGAQRVYRLSKPLHINRQVRLVSENGSHFASAPVFQFDPNRHGIIVDSAQQPSVFGGFGNSSVLDGLYIASMGTGGPVTHYATRTVTDAVVTALSTTLTSATASFTSNDVGKALIEVAGTDYNLAPGTSIKTVTNGTTVVLDQPATDSGTLSIVIGGGCGIVLTAPVLMNQVVSDGSFWGKWGGHGIYVKGETPYTNANVFQLWGCVSVYAELDGFHIEGSDANAGVLVGCTGNQPTGSCFRDDSFLGNTYVACNTAGGTNAYQIGTHAAGANVNTSTLFGCYREGGEPNFFGENVVVIGGQNMRDVAASGPGTTLIGNELRLNGGGKLSVSSDPTGLGGTRGDIVYSNAPSAGGTVGWVCTTGGGAGSAVWKTFGAITA